MFKRVLNYALIIMLFIIAVSCSQSQIMTIEKAEETLGISYDDFWDVEILLMEFSQKARDTYPILDYETYPGAEISEEYYTKMRESILGLTEEGRHDYFLRRAIITDEAQKQGFNSEMPIANDAAILDYLTFSGYIKNPSVDELKKGSPEYELYEKMEALSLQEKTTIEEYSQAMLNPIMQNEYANLYLERYFYENKFNGDYVEWTPLLTIEEGERLVAFKESYDAFIDKLVKS